MRGTASHHAVSRLHLPPLPQAASRRSPSVLRGGTCTAHRSAVAGRRRSQTGALLMGRPCDGDWRNPRKIGAQLGPDGTGLAAFVGAAPRPGGRVCAAASANSARSVARLPGWRGPDAGRPRPGRAGRHRADRVRPLRPVPVARPGPRPAGSGSLRAPARRQAPDRSAICAA